MFKPLVVLGISMLMAACAGTTQSAKTAASEECSLVDNDETGSKITVKQECKAVPGGQAASAPQS
jgi:hypothetical protein